MASLFNIRWHTQFYVLSHFFDTLWWIPTSGFSASLDNFCDRLDFDAGDKVSLHDWLMAFTLLVGDNLDKERSSFFATPSIFCFLFLKSNLTLNVQCFWTRSVEFSISLSKFYLFLFLSFSFNPTYFLMWLIHTRSCFSQTICHSLFLHFIFIQGVGQGF